MSLRGCEGMSVAVFAGSRGRVKGGESRGEKAGRGEEVERRTGEKKREWWNNDEGKRSATHSFSRLVDTTRTPHALVRVRLHVRDNPRAALREKARDLER